MSKRKDRRGFFRDAALITAGAVGGIAGGLFPTRTPAIAPINRSGTAKFKFSLAGYSYRKLLKGNPPELTLDDFLADCARFGLEGTEPTSYYFPADFTLDYLRHLKGLAFRLGLDISGTAVGNDFCFPPGPERDQQIANVKQWIDYAEILGAPVIRIFSGRPRKEQTEDEAHRLAVEGIEECCDYAGQHGVFLALENHGGLTTKIEGIMRLVDDVKSPWFGVNLDTGNFRDSSSLDEMYGNMARLAPYSLNVQVKVAVMGPDGKKVPSDFARLAQILTDAGYRGYIVLEYEEDEDPRVACPRYLDELREAFG
ncbi:MAG: sugar phosphate isomerase/epimerase family protein [Planctomycetota bacterium]